MIAYFALLSFVPLLFLAALAARRSPAGANESSYLVTELQRAFPSSSISSIVHAVREIQQHATALGIVGGAFLLWSSLSLFSVLESAFNIVYDRPNRSFLRGKAPRRRAHARLARDALRRAAVGSFGARPAEALRAGGSSSNSYVAYALSVVVSLVAVFVFLVAVYYAADERRAYAARTCCRARSSRRSLLEATLPGAAGLRPPLETTSVALQAFGGPVLLLVWLYVMANVIVFGAEVNWRVAEQRRPAADAEEAAGLA